MALPFRRFVRRDRPVIDRFKGARIGCCQCWRSDTLAPYFMGAGNWIFLTLGLVLQIFLLTLFVRRVALWKYPFFFAYIIYSILGTGALLATAAKYDLFYYVYWINDAGLSLLAVLALHEVFRRVFFGFYERSWWFRMLFPSAACLTILMIYLSAASSLRLLNNPVMRLILTFGISIKFMQAGLLVLLVTLAGSIRLRWRLAPLGIIFGFGISGFGSAVGYWARSEFRTNLGILSDYLPPVAYLLAIVVWLATFWKPQAGPDSLSAATLDELREEIQGDVAVIEDFRKKLKRSNDVPRSHSEN